MLFFGKKRIDEEALVKEALNAIPAYLRSHNITGTYSVDDCSVEVLKALKKAYCKAIGKSWMPRLTNNEAQELEAIANRNNDRIRNLARKRILEKTVKMKAKQINEVTARAAISSALQGSGYKLSIEAQCYRVKATILLPNGMAIMTPIKYKEIDAGKLNQIIDSVKALADQLTSMRRDITVYNAKQSVNWAGWQQL